MIELTDYDGSNDSAIAVEAAESDVPQLIAAFLRGSCATREAAYHLLREVVLATLPDCLYVLEDCHEDGCTVCSGEDPDTGHDDPEVLEAYREWLAR